MVSHQHWGGAANIAGIEWYSEHHHPPTMHAPGGFYQNLPNGSFISYRTTKGEYVIKKYTLTNPHPFDFQISLSADFTPDSVKKMKGGWNTLMNPYRHIGKRAFAFNVQLLPVAPRYNRQYIDSIESPYPDETSHRH